MKMRYALKFMLNCVAVFSLLSSAFAETRGVSRTEIKIGTHAPLTGPVAMVGVPDVNAIRLRFDEVNAAGGIHGRKLKYIAEDSQYRVPIAVQKANKLINRDKIFFIIGAVGAPQNIAAFKLLEKKQVPSVFPTTLSRSMVEPFHKLKFLHGATYYDSTRTAVRYFIEKKRKKRVCSMYQDTDYGAEVIDGIMDQLRVHNMKLIAKTTHKATETNFISAITKLKKADCDVVILGTIIRDTIISVATARKLNWKVDFVVQVPFRAIPDKGGPAMEGLYVMSGVPILYKDHTSGRAAAFFDNYQKRYGKVPNFAAQNGYLIADLAVLAMQKAGRNLTVDSLIKGLESIKGYQHIFDGPDMNFSGIQHKGSNVSVLLQVQKGRWVSPVPGKSILFSHK